MENKLVAIMGSDRCERERQVCMTTKTNMKDSYCDGSILYLNIINVNIPAGIFYGSIVRCYHGRSVGQGDLWEPIRDFSV